MPLRFLILFLLLCYSASVFTQEDLRVHSAFFQEQTADYSRWLDNNGLDELMAKPEILVRRRKVFLTLLLQRQAEAKMLAIWHEAKADFLKQVGVDLAERLYFRAQRLFELLPEQLEVIIIGQDEENNLPSLSLRITGRKTGEEIKLNFSGNFRQEEYAQDTLPTFLFDTTIRQKLLLAPNTVQSEFYYRLHQALRDSLVAHFTPRTVTGERPLLGSLLPVRISVKNLKGEVISPSLISFFDPHEYLDITLSVKPEPSGIAIYCIIDGRVGVSLWAPKSLESFHDMQPRYKKVLQRYVEDFMQTRIKPWIINFINQH